jgi:hypothetical protein
MALLTDERISTLERLQAIDASVVEVARVERVDLDRKLVMATDVVELRIKKFLLEHGLAGRVAGGDGEVDFGRIVVTPGLARWHALETLAMAYSDAYFSQLNDRYKRKWEHYRDLALDTARLLFDTGIGCVSSGVKRAAAPVVTGSGTPGFPGTYFVALVWKNAAGANGDVSEPSVLTTSELILVTPSESAPAGWTFDVYVGTAPDSMTKQNVTPLEAGATWAMPPGVLASGGAIPTGQPPEYYLRRDRLWQRG